VFFSTHILPDVETLCDRVAIMAAGSVRQIGRIDSLLADTTAGVEVIASGAPADALAGLAARATQRRGDSTVYEVADAKAANQLIDELRRLGASVTSVQPHRRTLEDVFVRAAAWEDRR
jgi:ABC-2 type transport system ATP-binding protein